MSIQFNADEVLEIAEQIERNGGRFYRAAAETIEDPKNRQMLLNLAALEDQHEKTFATMRTELLRAEKEVATFDPDDQTGEYLRAMADGKVFDVNKDPVEMMAEQGVKTMEDILRMAIGMEKDSVIYYMGMKAIVPQEYGREKIDKIIKEEMSHIGMLSLELGAIIS